MWKCRRENGHLGSKVKPTQKQVHFKYKYLRLRNANTLLIRLLHGYITERPQILVFSMLVSELEDNKDEEMTIMIKLSHA